MKTLKKTFAILLVGVIAFSCGNDDAPAATLTPTFDYFLKAKVDDVQFEAVAPRVLAGKTADRITISAILPDLRNFEITISNYPANPVGTYVVPAPASSTYLANLKFSDNSSSSSIFTAGTACGATGIRGTVIITAISATEISGTFSFTGTQTSGTCPRPTKVIREGSFKSGITQ